VTNPGGHERIRVSIPTPNHSRERGRKEAEGEGATGVPPARAAVAAPRSGHCRGALAPPPCPFREIGRKREGGEEKRRGERERGEEEIFLPVYRRTGE